MRPHPGHAVPVTFIEGNCGRVIDRCLQTHSTAACRVESLFGCSQQRRTNSAAPGRCTHINGDDVSCSACMSHDEPQGLVVALIECDQGERSPMTDVGFQFLFGIRNAGREAILVQAPERLEIFGLEVAYHGLAVVGVWPLYDPQDRAI